MRDKEKVSCQDTLPELNSPNLLLTSAVGGQRHAVLPALNGRADWGDRSATNMIIASGGGGAGTETLAGGVQKAAARRNRDGSCRAAWTE